MIAHTAAMTTTDPEFGAQCVDLIDEAQEQGGQLVISKNVCPVTRLLVAGKDKPWLALRGKGRFIGDAFLPVVGEKETEFLS